MERPERVDANQRGIAWDALRRCPYCNTIPYPDDIHCACCGKSLQAKAAEQQQPVCTGCQRTIAHPNAVYCSHCGEKQRKSVK